MYQSCINERPQSSPRNDDNMLRASCLKRQLPELNTQPPVIIYPHLTLVRLASPPSRCLRHPLRTNLRRGTTFYEATIASSSPISLSPSLFLCCFFTSPPSRRLQRPRCPAPDPRTHQTSHQTRHATETRSVIRSLALEGQRYVEYDRSTSIRPRNCSRGYHRFFSSPFLLRLPPQLHARAF